MAKKYVLNDRFSRGVRKTGDQILGGIGSGIYKALPKQKARLDKVADFGSRPVNIPKAFNNLGNRIPETVSKTVKEIKGYASKMLNAPVMNYKSTLKDSEQNTRIIAQKNLAFLAKAMKPFKK